MRYYSFGARHVREAGVGYRSRIAPEAQKWAARVNGYLHSTWRSMPAARGEASRLLGKIGFWIAQPGLEAACQRQLVELQRARRAVASVATSRRRLELQIAELERPAAGSQDANGKLSELRRQLAGLQAEEERVTAASRRLMAQVNAFRAGRDATKAAYAAAEEATQDMRTR
jgi:hypothetical protein